MTTHVPDAWDVEDWTPTRPSGTTPTRPNPTAREFSPHLLRSDFEQYTPNGQPLTTYRTDLKILKRAPDTPEVPTLVAPSEEIDKSRRERERKEKERRYREARERIMGESTTPSTSSSPTPTGTSTPKQQQQKQQQQQRKRSPDAAAGTTPKSKSPSQTPSGKQSTNNSRGTTPVSRNRTPPRVGGSVTSLSLNGGEFTAPPVVAAGARRYTQKVDGKLLESQLTAREDEEIVVDRDMEGGAYLGGVRLDWDDFTRELVPMQRSGYGAGAGEYDYNNNGNYGNGNYGNGNYANGNGNYGNVPYDYIPQFQTRPGQNPGIYGAAAGEGRFVYDKTPPEKNARAPGSMQAGVVQAVRVPRGPDGSRGFKGRGTGPTRNGVNNR